MKQQSPTSSEEESDPKRSVATQCIHTQTHNNSSSSKEEEEEEQQQQHNNNNNSSSSSISVYVLQHHEVESKTKQSDQLVTLPLKATATCCQRCVCIKSHFAIPRKKNRSLIQLSLYHGTFCGDITTENSSEYLWLQRRAFHKSEKEATVQCEECNKGHVSQSVQVMSVVNQLHCEWEAVNSNCNQDCWSRCANSWW